MLPCIQLSGGKPNPHGDGQHIHVENRPRQKTINPHREALANTQRKNTEHYGNGLGPKLMVGPTVFFLV